jgi:hypothetical protein
MAKRGPGARFGLREGSKSGRTHQYIRGVQILKKKKKMGVSRYIHENQREQHVKRRGFGGGMRNCPSLIKWAFGRSFIEWEKTRLAVPITASGLQGEKSLANRSM